MEGFDTSFLCRVAIYTNPVRFVDFTNATVGVDRERGSVQGKESIDATHHPRISVGRTVVRHRCPLPLIRCATLSIELGKLRRRRLRENKKCDEKNRISSHNLSTLQKQKLKFDLIGMQRYLSAYFFTGELFHHRDSHLPWGRRGQDVRDRRTSKA